MLFFVLCSVVLLLITLLPLHHSHVWWVRVCEFPRYHVFVMAVLLLPPTIVAGAFDVVTFCTVLILLGIIGYQGWWLYPYTPLATPEMIAAKSGAVGTGTTFVSLNVEMGNTQYEQVQAVIKQEKPDVLFLMETNQVWFDQLQSVLGTYATVVTELKDNYYGCVFATNLPVDDVQIHYVAGNNTPSVHAQLRTTAGDKFVFRGLHPRPPVPGNSTKKRDQEYKETAKFARVEPLPEIIMGDFNNVVWSRSAQRFKSNGQYVDPLIGRFNVNSFHGRYPFMRLPIDQLYVTKNVGLIDYYRGPYVGSDHFPMVAKLDI